MRLLAVLLSAFLASAAVADEAPVEKPAVVAVDASVAALVALPAVATPVIPPIPPTPVPVPTPDDLGAFAQALITAVASKQWGMLVALVLMGLVWAARKFLADKWPWLKTDRGGAVLSLLGGLAMAVAAAQFAPGVTSFWNVLLVAVMTSVTASGTYAILRKIIAPTGPELAKETVVVANAVAAKVEVDAKASPSAAADAINKVGN